MSLVLPDIVASGSCPSLEIIKYYSALNFINKAKYKNIFSVLFFSKYFEV